MSDSIRNPEDNCPSDKIIIYPNNNELFIDIDKIEDQNEFYKLMDILLENKYAKMEILSLGKETGHSHIKVSFLEDTVLSQSLRVAFQASLGSDRKRELLACIQLLNDQPANTCFFETKK